MSTLWCQIEGCWKSCEDRHIPNLIKRKRGWTKEKLKIAKNVVEKTINSSHKFLKKENFQVDRMKLHSTICHKKSSPFKEFGNSENVPSLLRIELMLSKTVIEKKYRGIPQQGSIARANYMINYTSQTIQ